MPYPLQADSEGQEALAEILGKHNGALHAAATSDRASFRATADLLDLVADRFKQIIEEHGPDAVAGISCARSINEDSYQMQKLFRAVFGTNNIDHCART